MKIYLLDASVMLISLLEKDTKRAGKAKEIFRGSEKGHFKLCVLPLTIFEVANGLRFSLKDQTLAEQILGKFQQLPLEVIPLTTSAVTEALRLSYSLKATVYDASYHVAAKMLEATFLTGDSQYFAAAKSLGNIELL